MFALPFWEQFPFQADFHLDAYYWGISRGSFFEPHW